MPASLKYESKNYYRLPESYLTDVLYHDINYDGAHRDKEKMLRLLRSLARNESTLVTIEKLINDVDKYTNQDNYQISRNTITDYLNVLSNIHLIENQLPYSEKIRSSVRVGKNVKRHFVDPSLACATLGLKQEHLLKDMELFGFMFESLVIRDLRIYIEHLEGKLYHFHDNNTGREVDAIVELRDGEYGAIEVKLGVSKIDEVANNLLKFVNYCEKKPKFLCVICGMIDYAYRRSDGVYVLPITALKP